jgi:hypothetical protein
MQVPEGFIQWKAKNKGLTEAINKMREQYEPTYEELEVIIESPSEQRIRLIAETMEAYMRSSPKIKSQFSSVIISAFEIQK